MKEGFKKAGKIFKYLAILFTIAYWVFIVIDDWVFIENYWTERWAEYIGIWFIWFLIYFLTLSFYYWGISTIVILIYYKLIQRNKTADNQHVE